MESSFEDALDLEMFAHVVAHDLGAPLRGISIHLRLLERELEGTGIGHERIRLLQGRLRQLDAMLRRVRSFSRIQSGLEQAGPTDLAAAIQESWERLDAPRHTLHLTGTGTTDAPPLPVHMVLGELLRNAVDHDDRDAGEVHVRIEGTSVTIQDDGPGLPAEPAVLFEPFAKAGTTIDDGRGAGLALARLVARRLGGDVQLDSDGRGTTAHVRL